MPFFVLVDSRIEPQQIDVDFINHAGAHNIPIAIVFTKADRLNSPAVKGNIEKLKNTLGQTMGRTSPIFVTSSARKTGKRGAACVYRRNQCFAEIEVSILYHNTPVAA